MFGIIIGSHGIFSVELLKSCEILCGEQKYVRTVTLVPGETLEDVTLKYQEAGGSPYNAAAKIVRDNPLYGIVTGANLPMLIELTSAQETGEDMSIKTLMEKAIEAGKNGTQPFHASLVEEDEGE